MCKEGRVQEAYEVAKKELEANVANEWAQRMVGWALYYKLKEAADSCHTADFCNHLQELMSLELLSPQHDSMIFENALWKVIALLSGASNEDFRLMDNLFTVLQQRRFPPSNAYSVLLKSVIKFDGWDGLVLFFEWWNIDNLLPEDYEAYVNAKGRQIMSLAEQAYISYSKALLKLHDRDKIAAFLPKIKNIIDKYPQMMYPGYFYGKLVLAMGHGNEGALEILAPFVRRKRGEFWVWQLLAEFYGNDEKMLFACLLRATHCKTSETFLGKVRIKLIGAYIAKGAYARAKYHIDKVTHCYLQQGWRLPYEIQNLIRESWVNNTAADDTDIVDYKTCTDEILLYGTNESIALVTYIDEQSKRATIIYGNKLRATVKLASLGCRVSTGMLLKLRWLPGDNAPNIYAASIVRNTDACDNTYMRKIAGCVERRDTNPFAFVRSGAMHCYIPPQTVQKFNLASNDQVELLAVLDYNKKKEEWSWVSYNLIKKQ